MTKALIGMAMAIVVIGCESGEEITGVASATATRQADGIVVVSGKTSCDLKWGMGRMDNNCDSDGDDACFRADWVERSHPGKILFTARTCKEIDHAYRGAFTITSPAPIPADKDIAIHVYAEDNACGSSEASPGACGPTITSPTK